MVERLGSETEAKKAPTIDIAIDIDIGVSTNNPKNYSSCLCIGNRGGLLDQNV
jgi:hypothetical protein